VRAVTWHGRRDVRVETVPDPRILEPTDAIVRITTSGLCGSDLHLYEVFGPFLEEGDILGHEPMGIVEEVGTGVPDLSVGDRVVVPFVIACGTCWMCRQGLQTQCETTQVRAEGMGAALLGYTRLYGSVPGGQAEYLRVPQAQYGPIRVPHGPPDDRFVYLSDVLPTAWQALEYAEVPPGGSLAVIGLGPIGEMVCRLALARGVERVIGVEVIPERIDRSAGLGVRVLDGSRGDDAVDKAVRELTDGRGADAVVDAVGLEAHGWPVVKLLQTASNLMPDVMSRPMLKRASVDRMTALLLAIRLVRRGGTLSLVGVYAGAADPLPMMTLFDKQIQLRMGQANVRRWTDELMPFLMREDDPLGVDGFATHRLPLEDAPDAYAMFQRKERGAIKVLFQP
jgi:threonine dehydrogenase-like Zn-dependent dehydrogenase